MAQQVGQITLQEFQNAIAAGFRQAKEQEPKREYEELIEEGDEVPVEAPQDVQSLYQRLGNPQLDPRARKEQIIKEFDRLGAMYVSNPNETNADLLRRLDFINKIKLQNEAYAAFMKGEQKVEKGFAPTSTFSQEKILQTAINGSPTSKVIRFTNGISEIKIVPDGNGQYFGVQKGQRFGPSTFKEIERWAQLGGYEAREMKELKNVMESIKDPEKMHAVVFRARKL